jgi:hypothetical protein
MELAALSKACIVIGRSQDSSVGIVTGYGLDNQGEWEFESQ